MTAFLPEAFSEIVLASTSSARQTLLLGLGIPFRAIAPMVDEVVSAELTVAESVAELALRKATAVAQRFPKALVVGSDQLVDIDGEALGKPENEAAARVQLKRMSGRTHQILTAVALVGPDTVLVEVDTASLTLHALSTDDIEFYLATEEWKGCAGGYRIEGRGQALFSCIYGDRTAIQGLPMQLLLSLFRQVGVNVLAAPLRTQALVLKGLDNV